MSRWKRTWSSRHLVNAVSALVIGSGCDGSSGEPDMVAQPVAGPAPDYVVAAMTEPPATATIGVSFPITTTVDNVGDAAAATTSTTRFFLSSDPVIGGDHSFVQTVTVAPLGIGASDTQTVMLAPRSGVAAGSYFVVACADRNNTVPERSNNNNCTSSTGTVDVAGPDLVVSALADPPANVAPNGSFSVADTTANTGDAASAPSVTRLLLSLDAVRGNDVLLAQRAVPGLAAAASSAADTQLVIRPSTPAGTYFLLACADGRSAVSELIETNNCRAAAGQVTVTGAVCGDAVLSPGEECEDGNLVDGDGCDSNCTPSACGNGVTANDEECDDGNDVNGDGCDVDCTLSACGNGIPAGDEECDDGNQVEGDGCDSNCTATACGNGIVTAGEWCDDGNNTDGDGCEADCTVTGCGDGSVGGDEECDDGNDVDGDGCDTNCTLTACGNGIVTDGEVCDDHDVTSNDGCDADCAPSAAVQVVAGETHTCILTRTGGVRCWGQSDAGQLGYGNTERIGDDEVPAAAGDVDIGGTAVQLAAGMFHTCALLDTGGVRCWGFGEWSWGPQLGYGRNESIGDDETPASAGDVPVGGAVVQLTAGERHTCALLEAGTVRCWGAGVTGALGYGNVDDIGDDETPASAGDVDVGGNVVHIAAGHLHTCGVLDTGAVRCWGTAFFGELGYGDTLTIGDDEVPAAAGPVVLGGPAVELAAGTNHTCARMATGDLRCWGRAAHGQLGYGNTRNVGDSFDPVLAGTVQVGGPVAHVFAGALNTCALLTSGSAHCWGLGPVHGHNTFLAIGDDESPASVGPLDMGGQAIQIAISGNHGCALMDTGGVRCWGQFYLPYASPDPMWTPSSNPEAELFRPEP